MKNEKAIKGGIAGAALLIAVVLLANYFGVFGSGESSTPVAPLESTLTADEKKEFDKAQEQSKQLIQKRGGAKGSS